VMNDLSKYLKDNIFKDGVTTYYVERQAEAILKAIWDNTEVSNQDVCTFKMILERTEQVIPADQTQMLIETGSLLFILRELDYVQFDTKIPLNQLNQRFQLAPIGVGYAKPRWMNEVEHSGFR